MRNKFKTDEETIINFSGGRTSGYLLKMVLDAYGGKLPDNFVVLFQNTGKEFPQTLDFVKEVSDRWNVDIVWLEWQRPTHKKENGRWAYPNDEEFTVVNYGTASRKGEPFEQLIDHWGYVPNVKQRWCTDYLKQRVARSYARQRLGWKYWQSFLGIRHDEPRRWRARGQNPKYKKEERELPLVDAGVTKEDVARFWASQDFDVRLPQGVSNCDLCFLKGKDKKLSVIRENEGITRWWSDMENKTGRTFDKSLRYEDLAAIVKKEPVLPIFNDEDISTCFCTD